MDVKISRAFSVGKRRLLESALPRALTLTGARIERVGATRIPEFLGYVNPSQCTTVYLARSATYSWLLKILCHELTHIAQYQSGRLWQDSRGFYWLGEFWLSGRDYENLSMAQYEALPWEAEAMRSEHLAGWI
jgi:hypothetical protein